jgi:hypothetical protein
MTTPIDSKRFSAFLKGEKEETIMFSAVHRRSGFVTANSSSLVGVSMKLDTIGLVETEINVTLKQY